MNTVLSLAAVYAASVSLGVAAISYTDVTTANTSGLTGGSGPWSERTTFGSGGSVWQGSQVGNNELTTTISGLKPNQAYLVTVFFWDDKGLQGNISDWNIDASLILGGSFVTYRAGSAGTAQAYDVHQTNPITGLNFQGTFALRAGLSDDSPTGNANADEGNRDLWIGTVGTTTSNGSGEVVVHADWGEIGSRAWYDGVGVELVPEPHTSTLGLLGALLLIYRRRSSRSSLRPNS